MDTKHPHGTKTLSLLKGKQYRECRKTKKSADLSKLANNSFFSRYHGIVCLTARCFLYQVTVHAKGPLNSLPPALECSALPTDQGSLQELHCFPSKNRGKD